MKKFFLLLLMAVAFCGSADAQKGMKGVGMNINGSVTDEILNIGASAKFQYNVNNYVRAEASAAYYLHGEVNDCGFELAIMANAHFFVMSPKRIRPYFITGIGYASVREEDKSSYPYKYAQGGGMAANVGVGLDWRITTFLSLQAECSCISLLHDDVDTETSGIAFGIGTCFNF